MSRRDDVRTIADRTVALIDRAWDADLGPLSRASEDELRRAEVARLFRFYQATTIAQRAGTSIGVRLRSLSQLLEGANLIAEAGADVLDVALAEVDAIRSDLLDSRSTCRELARRRHEGGSR